MAKGGGSGSNHYEVQSRDATEPKLTDYGSNRATAAPRRRAAGRIEPQRKESGFIRIFPGFLRNSWREFVTLLRGTLRKREFFRPVSTRTRARALPAARGRIPGVAAFRINPRCGTLMRRAHYLEVLDGVGAQMSKKTMSVHCPVCNVSSPRDLSELARPSGKSCLICGAFLSDYAWGELATALLAVQQLSDHFRAGVRHAR